jgi:hypothetical protein
LAIGKVCFFHYFLQCLGKEKILLFTSINLWGITQVVYIAHEDNVAFLVEASEHQIALQVLRCSGPSGKKPRLCISIS